jgi:hypothetical protein
MWLIIAERIGREVSYRQSAQKHSSQHRRPDRRIRRCFHRHANRCAFGHPWICFRLRDRGGLPVLEPRISPTGMGDVLLLRTPDEGGLPGTAEGADYHRSLWLLQKPTLSRRKRLHLLRSGAVAGITDRTRHHRHPHSAGRSFHHARGTAVGEAVR